MRRRLLTVVLCAVAAIIMAVPLWAALTSEHSILSGHLARPVMDEETVQLSPRLAEAGTLVITGIVLIGLASAVRRTH